MCTGRITGSDTLLDVISFTPGIFSDARGNYIANLSDSQQTLRCKMCARGILVGSRSPREGHKLKACDEIE